MTQSSSIGQVQVWLRGFVDSMNFTWSGNDQSLGRDVAWKVVEQIEDRAQREKRGIGEEWEANALDYAAWKEKRYGIVDLPNTRIGHMLSHQKLFGRTCVEAEQVTMIYGTNEPTTRTKTGVPLTEADKKVTDTQKAYFAHTVRRLHGTTRKFYEVSEADGRVVSELCQENLNDLIRDTNAASGY
jgi:hypothetical protein